MKTYSILCAKEVRDILEALRLCECSLREFARTDDGTPSISALHMARDVIDQLEAQS